jgi:formylglycine-generating enzyme required for sulfatase activity
MLSLELAAGVVMEFVRVPAGEFTMGSAEAEQSYPDEQPQHKVFLDEYLIGKYLVTNRQYQAFLHSTGYSHWEHGTVLANKDNHPVVSISWRDALAFCQWVSTLAHLKIRLPSEAEWEKAARGTDGRTYPWGNQRPDNNLLNYNRAVGDTTQVGAYPAGVSPYGALDMAGNAWEWVNDIYDLHYYASSPASNPPGPASGEYRVLRGGAWSSTQRNVRSVNRLSSLPTDAGTASGFRCARSISV